MEYYKEILTGESQLEQLRLILLLSQLTPAGTQHLKHPDICVGAFCDFLEQKPILTVPEYESKHNIRVGYGRDYTFLKTLKSFDEERHDLTLEKLDDWTERLSDQVVAFWFNPQSADILENPPFLTMPQCISTLATATIYQNSLSDTLSQRVLQLLFQSPSYFSQPVFLDTKDYDNNERVDQHLTTMLDRIIDEGSENEHKNIEILFMPDIILQEFINSGLYLNQTDHEKSNWAQEQARKNSNPYTLLHLAQTYGLNIFQKNNRGESAYDKISQEYPLQTFLSKQEFPALLQLKFKNEPTTIGAPTEEEKHCIEQTLIQFEAVYNFSVNDLDFHKHLIDAQKNFLSKFQDYLEKGMVNIFAKQASREDLKKLEKEQQNSQPESTLSFFLNLLKLKVKELKAKEIKDTVEDEDFFSSELPTALLTKHNYLNHELFQRYQNKTQNNVGTEFYDKFQPQHTLYEVIDDSVIDFELNKSPRNIIAFLYYNTHVSDTQFIECMNKTPIKELLTQYQGYNILGLCLAQKRSNVLSELLGKPDIMAYVETSWPEISTIIVKKINNFQELFKSHPSLLGLKNKDGDNFLHWAAKHHHVKLLGEIIPIAPSTALKEKNNNQISFLGYFAHNDNTSEKNKMKTMAYLEKIMAHAIIMGRGDDSPPMSTPTRKAKYKI